MKTPEPSQPTRLRQSAANFWLARFFWLCDHAPRLTRAARPLFCVIAIIFSPALRRASRANARYLLGPNASYLRRLRLLYRTLSSFYLFCYDVARCRHSTPEELCKRVSWIGGRDVYRQARSAHRGMIIVTAHVGSFEVALCELRTVEEHVHVLFRRDAISLFEEQRRALRQRLGIHEAALDDGWTIWIRLREAVLNDQVVVIQGDRVLPNQKGRCVRILGGEMELPMAPIKLAAATGAPILPIFSLRAPDGTIQLLACEPIYVQAGEDESVPLSKWAKLLEQQIAANPHQWLTLCKAWR